MLFHWNKYEQEDGDCIESGDIETNSDNPITSLAICLEMCATGFDDEEWGDESCEFMRLDSGHYIIRWWRGKELFELTFSDD